MASYTAINGVLLALEQFFTSRMPAALSAGPVNARVELLGSADIGDPLSGNVLGIYLHRIEIDPHGRSRFFSPQGANSATETRELPINLHLLLIASASSATIEANIMAWAMIQLANECHLDISHMAENDDSWTEKEILTVTPAEMSNEDLMRIWDALDTPYTNSVPYIVKTIRLRLQSVESVGPPVITRVFPHGTARATRTEATGTE